MGKWNYNGAKGLIQGYTASSNKKEFEPISAQAKPMSFQLNAIILTHTGVLETQRKMEAFWHLSRGNYAQSKTVLSNIYVWLGWVVDAGETEQEGKVDWVKEELNYQRAGSRLCSWQCRTSGPL